MYHDHNYFLYFSKIAFVLLLLFPRPTFFWCMGKTVRRDFWHSFLLFFIGCTRGRHRSGTVISAAIFRNIEPITSLSLYTFLAEALSKLNHHMGSRMRKVSSGPMLSIDRYNSDQ